MSKARRGIRIAVALSENLCRFNLQASFMNTNFKAMRSGFAATSSIASSRANVSHAGTMRAVILSGIMRKADQALEAAKAVEESIIQAFGETAHDAQLEADQNMYAFKSFSTASDTQTNENQINPGKPLWL